MDGEINQSTLSNHLTEAIRNWQGAIGVDRVFGPEEAARRYSPNVEAIRRSLLGALQPQTTEEVVRCVSVSNLFKIPLYPVSTGKNWGYGTANPVEDNCIVLDLSRMNRILQLDRELGLITLEPGVTHGQLWEFFNRNHLDYLVPCTGAGPDTSLVGNAIERGFGIIPFADHFGALTALKAVLPTGEIYQSLMSDLGCVEIDRCHKWGLGPYADGLMTQSNLGIVTEATFALVERPKNISLFVFKLKKEEDLDGVIDPLRELLASIGSNISSISLLNAKRVQATRKKEQPPKYAWAAIGCLQADDRLMPSLRDVIRKKIRRCVYQLIMIDGSQVRFLKNLLDHFPFAGNLSLTDDFNGLALLLRHLSGDPNASSLPLCYHGQDMRVPVGKRIDPAQDGCGLLWYAPLVPMKREKVREFVNMLERVMPPYGFEPMITLLTLSSRCFDSPIPILFRTQNQDQSLRAHQCYEALFAEGRKLGFAPYRMGVYGMHHLTQGQSHFLDFIGNLKQTLDPNHILAPKRYGR